MKLKWMNCSQRVNCGKRAMRGWGVNCPLSKFPKFVQNHDLSGSDKKTFGQNQNFSGSDKKNMCIIRN